MQHKISTEVRCSGLLLRPVSRVEASGRVDVGVTFLECWFGLQGTSIQINQRETSNCCLPPQLRGRAVPLLKRYVVRVPRNNVHPGPGRDDHENVGGGDLS